MCFYKFLWFPVLSLLTLKFNRIISFAPPRFSVNAPPRLSHLFVSGQFFGMIKCDFSALIRSEIVLLFLISVDLERVMVDPIWPPPSLLCQPSTWGRNHRLIPFACFAVTVKRQFTRGGTGNLLIWQHAFLCLCRGPTTLMLIVKWLDHSVFEKVIHRKGAISVQTDWFGA